MNFDISHSRDLVQKLLKIICSQKSILSSHDIISAQVCTTSDRATSLIVLKQKSAAQIRAGSDEEQSTYKKESIYTIIILYKLGLEPNVWMPNYNNAEDTV